MLRMRIGWSFGLFFRNEGDDDHPDLTIIAAEQQADPADHDIKSDLAGRKPGNPGVGGGSTAGEADFHQQAEDRFAADTALMLKSRALANDFESLIIIAPPQTLGELRKHYHGEVSKRLAGEIAKDLVNHPVDKIEDIIAQA